MARKLAAVAFSLGCFHASSLMALGLGEMKMESFLNEPLKASVDLLNMGGLHGDEIKVRLGTTEDFKKLGLDRDYFLTNISFEVITDGSGSARILITSQEPVLEPYLDFIIEARWPSGRLLREYTILIDPPVFSQATPVVSASERVQEVEASAKKNEPVASSGASQSTEDSNLGDWGSVGGGTRVDVRDSDLAPGAMPQRNYGSSAASAPVPGSRYMIRRDQTLWEIASQSKPTGASVHQTMLEIQRLNPDAFINGNINRIKAGYIIYLPTADDVSSVDLSTALAEVRQQNESYQAGRDEEVYAQSRPKLTISAEPEDAAEPQAESAAVAPAPASSTPKVADATDGSVAPSVATAPGQGANDEDRLAAMEQQLETLQRIVSLKDDQISALQSALKEAGASAEIETGTTTVQPGSESLSTEAEALKPADSAAPPLTEETASSAAIEQEAPAAEVAPVADEKPAKTAEAAGKPDTAKKPKTTTESAADVERGWTGYILYILGAIVLAIAGFVFARRRNAPAGEVAPASQRASNEDVFSDVRLRDTKLELMPDAEEVDTAPPTSKRNNRGYGERKHDEYASDVDAADALAEADIYIAYGRHPQAIDLLNNALTNEPNNPVYRLKLLEIYTELNNRVAATAQLNKIQALGDADSTARAEALMEGLQSESEIQPPKADNRKPLSASDRLPPNPLAMMPDTDEPLVADFSGLEIESSDTGNVEDDLDLSSDFASGSRDVNEDEELVIAADSNGLSTKLDLARAYLDMGDDEGARQILDEVVAEGSEELRAEARTLLNRIGG
jgi:pilus assembly protein FimV